MLKPTLVLGVLGVLGVLAIAAPTAFAQSATIRGTVVDSLHGRGLAGASVSVDGTAANAVTDSLGQYRLDSVPPGTYRIAVYHPLLDSLNIVLYTNPIPIPAAVETVVGLAVPSRVTLMARSCGADTSAHVLAAGRVLDVDNDMPIQNATVTASVNLLSVTANPNTRAIVRRGTLTRTVKTDADGRFNFCLPAGGRYTVVANLGNSLTGEIPLDVSTGIAMPTLRVSRADSASVGSRAAFGGRVLNGEGKPIEDATVTVQGTVAEARTGHGGRFHLDAVPGGTQVVSVKHVGFAEAFVPADLSSTSTRTIPTITLAPQVATLPVVDVRGEAVLVAAAYDRTGFNRRKNGPVGQFVTADQIARHNSGTTLSLLEAVPGVRAQYGRGGGVRLVTTRGVGGPYGRTCTGYMVDGQNVSRGPNGDDQFLPKPQDIIGIEVYQPGEPIGGAPPSNCLVVMLWTKAELR